jgi:hypothetical protein
VCRWQSLSDRHFPASSQPQTMGVARSDRRDSGMGESMCVEGATDAKAFEVYIEHFLAPTLKEGQGVVMDNLGAHRPKR